MAQTPEAKVKAEIRKYLTSLGAFHFNPIGGPFSAHGIPDIVGCWHGVFFGIECKAPGRKGAATENQKARLAEIEAAGGIAVIADCTRDVFDAIVAHRKQTNITVG